MKFEEKPLDDLCMDYFSNFNVIKVDFFPAGCSLNFLLFSNFF